MWPLPEEVHIIDYPKPAVFHSCEVFHLLARIHQREKLEEWSDEWLEFWDRFAISFPARCPHCLKDEAEWKDPPPPPFVFLRKGGGIMSSAGVHLMPDKSRFSILFPYSSRQALKMIPYLDAGTIAHPRKSYHRRYADFPVRKPHGGLLASDGRHLPSLQSRFSRLFPYTSRKAIAMVNWADPGPPPIHPIKVWRDGKPMWDDPAPRPPMKPYIPPPPRPRKILKTGQGLMSSGGRRLPTIKSRFSTLFPYTSRKALQMLPWADPGPLPIHPIKTFPKRIPPEQLDAAAAAADSNPNPNSTQALPPQTAADGKRKQGQKGLPDAPPAPPSPPEAAGKQKKGNKDMATPAPPAPVPPPADKGAKQKTASKK